MVRYIALGIKRRSEAERIKRKAVNEGFKGLKIIPFKSVGQKRPVHYDVTYNSINPMIKKIRKMKNKTIVTYMRRTPKGLIKVSSEVRKK